MAFPLVSSLFGGMEYGRPSLNPFCFSEKKFFASCITVFRMRLNLRLQYSSQGTHSEAKSFRYKWIHCQLADKLLMWQESVCVCEWLKFWPLFSNIWCPARISTRSNPLHYLCEWNKECLPHCWNYADDIMLYCPIFCMQLTIRYFRLILMTYAHGPCLNLVCKNASTWSFLTRSNYNPPQTTCTHALFPATGHWHASHLGGL